MPQSSAVSGQVAHLGTAVRTPNSAAGGAPHLRLWLAHPTLGDAWPAEGLLLRRLPFVVGRMPEDDVSAPRNHVDLQLPDRRPYLLSRVHFCVLEYRSRLAVMDTDSQLGTYVNGTPIGRRGTHNHAFLVQGTNLIEIARRDSRFRFTLEVC
jgi:hypothetical protein